MFYFLMIDVHTGAVAAGAGMATGAVIGKKVREKQLEQNSTELQNLNVATDMAATQQLRQEMVNYNKPNVKQKSSTSEDLATTSEQVFQQDALTSEKLPTTSNQAFQQETLASENLATMSDQAFQQETLANPNTGNRVVPPEQP